jgi:AraC-like DNA-binding protein
MEHSYPKVYLYRRIVRAKLFIDTNYNHPLDLHNIAEEALFSRFHFLRLFRKAYGRTPHQYLIFVRIQKSMELLKKEHHRVSDICFEVGFESVSSFSSLFKRYTGDTPSEFQKKHLNRIDDCKRIPLKFIPACFISALG